MLRLLSPQRRLWTDSALYKSQWPERRLLPPCLLNSWKEKRIERHGVGEIALRANLATFNSSRDSFEELTRCVKAQGSYLIRISKKEILSIRHLQLKPQVKMWPREFPTNLAGR